MNARGRPFEFHTFVSIKLASDKELMDLMVRASFIKVWIGIETTDVEALTTAHKHHNVTTDLDLACREINRAGLMILATFIIGFDGERPGVKPPRPKRGASSTSGCRSTEPWPLTIAC